jgi:hypothetical protein
METQPLSTCVTDNGRAFNAICSECATCTPDAGAHDVPGVLPFAAVWALLWSQLL